MIFLQLLIQIIHRRTSSTKLKRPVAQATENPTAKEGNTVKLMTCNRAIVSCLLAAVSFIPLTWLPGSEPIAYRVKGTSMQPTFKSGDIAWIDTSYFKEQQLERGMLVAIQLKTKKIPLLKRVVAVAGDKVSIQNGQIEAGGRSYAIPNRGAFILTKQLARYDNQVPASHFIALGDNPEASLDSASLGLLSQNQLMGYVYANKPEELDTAD